MELADIAAEALRQINQGVAKANEDLVKVGAYAWPVDRLEMRDGEGRWHLVTGPVQPAAPE